MIFSENPYDRSIERLMTQIPNFKPRGGGLFFSKLAAMVEFTDAVHCHDIGVLLDHVNDFGFIEGAETNEAVGRFFVENYDEYQVSMALEDYINYTYFKSKEEAIIACADEAAARLEQGLIIPALKETDDLDALLTKTLNRADKYMPEMKLLVQVSTTPKYSEMMKPTLNRLCERYRIYTEKFAAKLNCKPEELAPYVYMCITAYTNYMTFGTKEYILPQLEIVKQAVEKMKNSKENTHEKDV